MIKTILQRLKALERHINGNENEQIIITLGDETLVFKNQNELIDCWLASFDDEEAVVP